MLKTLLKEEQKECFLISDVKEAPCWNFVVLYARSMEDCEIADEATVFSKNVLQT